MDKTLIRGRRYSFRMGEYYEKLELIKLTGSMSTRSIKTQNIANHLPHSHDECAVGPADKASYI